MRTLILTAIAFTSFSAFGCSFDTDCAPGNRCLKNGAALYGMCVGGLTPGNDYDSQPVYNPYQAGSQAGNTCSFSTQCGVGESCVKRWGALYGTCQ